MKRSDIILTVFVALIGGAWLVAACGGGGGGDNGTFEPIVLASPGVVFVTSVTGTGNLGTWTDAGGNVGLDAADAICAARASAGGLSGTFVAWMSDDNDDAYCRIHGLEGKKSDNCGLDALPLAAGPWIRTDSYPFSEAIEILTGLYGAVYTPVRYDEFGSEVPAGQHYLTGTRYRGQVDITYTTCSSWMSSNAGSAVIVGSANGTVASWVEADIDFCDEQWSLVCMQVGTAPPLPDFASSGKKVFITSGSYLGDLSNQSGVSGTGVAAGDDICREHASTAGFADTINYKAWLSDSNNNAADRITSDGPWVRLDGVKVADNKADLLDGSLFTGITVDENVQYRGGNVWTGTLSTGSKSADTCSNWSARVHGTYGGASYADESWTEFWFQIPLGLGAHFYCFED